MTTDLRTCRYCGVRVIFAMNTGTGGRLPALNYGPDPAGPVAVTRERTGAWGGRFLAAGEDALPTEKRHSVHECDGTRRHAQRGNWAATFARQRADQRRNRGRRPGPGITGIRVPPPTLPGMGDRQ